MDFRHPNERQQFADMLHRYLASNYGFEAREDIARSEAGWSREQWRQLADLGAVGALFAESHGGYGGDAFDIAVVFEQLGKALVVEPFLPTLMAGHALQLAGGQEALVGAMIAGETLVTFAHHEPQARYALSDVLTIAERSANGWSVSGTKSIVVHLEAADHVVVSARIAQQNDMTGIALFLVDTRSDGVAMRGYPMIDGGRGGELTLANAPATRLGDASVDLLAIEKIVATGTLALTWEAIGILDALKAATLDYMRTRRQFGVAIGAFQALQHRMATIALEIEQARSAAINAAAGLSSDRRARERAVSAAKYTIGRVGTLVAEEVIQLHGGIGMTWELPLSHHAKRLLMIGHQLGDEDHHLERFIALAPVDA
ncbi:MAG: pimeloyl-CoA dehydrogenase small subunit [Acidobacteria bacterium]|nr:pimeloyl-CoA dehydrogenase small subunit [Acidobacteriota bacterium]|tara:strand:- start:515 stop:1633 length:1119 start_codon:yes stop_codon:yes gene_type:complete